MWPDRVSNPGPLTYKSGALPTALRGPAVLEAMLFKVFSISSSGGHFFSGAERFK